MKKDKDYERILMQHILMDIRQHFDGSWEVGVVNPSYFTDLWRWIPYRTYGDTRESAIEKTYYIIYNELWITAKEEENKP